MADYMLSLLHADQESKTNLDLITEQLLGMLKVKNYHLFHHAVQVCNYSEAIACKMRLPSSEIIQIKYAALLHDIGLIMLPNTTIKKYPYLNRQELSRYNQHAAAGANMLENYACCQQIIPYIMYHHERWDGSGFPKHLKRDNIPIGARIIGAADFYDSCVNPATEYWAKTKSEAKRELLSAAGLLFDPEVIKAFIEVLGVD